MKAVKRTALVLLPMVFLIFLPILGCGGVGVAPDGDPVAMFGAARQNLDDAESYRMAVEMTMDFHFSEASQEMGIFEDDMEMSLSAEMFCEREDGRDIARIVADVGDFSEQTMGETDTYSEEGDQPDTVEAYIVDEEAYYQEEPGGEWIYEEFAPGEDFFSALDQSELSPRFVVEALDDYKEIEVIEETDAYIVYELTVDYMTSLGVSSPYYEDSLMRVKVDRESSLPSEILISQEGNLAEAYEEYDDPVFEDPEFMAVMEGSTYRFLYSIEFSEYGRDFDIRIPQEALDAKPH